MLSDYICGMKITVLLVDDEPLACEELHFLLRDIENITVVGVAYEWEIARNLIQELQPDVLMLDIELGQKNGFELLESLDIVPEVIFVTAYNQYALKAFEYNALHYLLKPIDENILQKAIQKVVETIGNKKNNPAMEKQKSVMNSNSKVFIKDGEDCFFVALQDIYLIETVGNYSRVYFDNKKPLLHKSLNILEEKLPEELFFRANRSQIINLNYIKEIHPNFKSKLFLYLKQGNEIEISTRQSARFRELMSL